MTDDLTPREEELHRLQGVRVKQELAEEEKLGPAPHLGGGPFGSTGLTHPDDQ
ncbi:hypothetical protein [Nocardiopsis eucommiae]|uniref:hypothetical protein n=1 Tax=Nocardiopsis eucommiae TaxID=2831970 RepID=UPI003D73BD9D